MVSSNTFQESVLSFQGMSKVWIRQSRQEPDPPQAEANRGAGKWLLALYGFLFACLLFFPVRLADAATISAGPTGLTGVVNVNPGSEVVIYSVRIVRDPPPQEVILRIGIVVEDLTVPTGISNADFTALNLYEDQAGGGSGAFDAGDLLLGTVAGGAIVLGGETDIPAAGATLLPGGAGRYYFITAQISAGATIGHAFRVGTVTPAPANNIDIDQDPPGPGGFDGVTDQTLDGFVMPADANRVVIQAAGGGGGGGGGGGAGVVSVVDTSGAVIVLDQPKDIPFGGEWLFALAALAYGVYALYRHR
jgi:hypothetical protein